MTKEWFKYSVCALAMTLIACAITLMVLERLERSETVDGIKWYYSISNSKAKIGSRNGCAIPISTVGSISIPKVLGGCPVTSIGRDAFRGCDRLITVIMPEGVTNIGERAFARCGELTTVTIPSSVTSIGDCAFACCRGLTKVTIPSSVTSIGSYAFSHCSGLKSVTIPSSVTRIGDDAFDGCDRLDSKSRLAIRKKEDAVRREERMNNPAYKLLEKWYDMQLDENGWMEVNFYADVDHDCWSLSLQDCSNPTTTITYNRGVGLIQYSRWLSEGFASRLIKTRIRMFEIENGIKEKGNAH